MTRSQKIPMSSISALTLHGDQMTTSRRVSPVPQLKCIGRACRSYQPPTVQCVPIGSSGENDVQWKCEADLPKGYRFGSVEVGCEGWDDSSDPYILRGSCGLTYNLVKTAAFEESSYRALPTQTSNISWPALALGALALYLLFQALRPRFPARFPSWNDARRWGGSWGGGPGGGGPGFGGGGSPPPYSPKPPGTDAAWQPGFWTGLAAGAAALQGANYLRGDGRRQQQQRQGWGVRDDDDRGVGGSGSWGRPATGNGGGGAMRPSTGFGGTRNR